MTIKHASDIPAETVPAGAGTSPQVLIGPEEGPHVASRRFVIEPGGQSPAHTNTVGHEQYVLGGRGTVGIDDRVFQVQENDVVFIPADVPHWYRTEGDLPFEFLCVVPNLPDEMRMVG